MKTAVRICLCGVLALMLRQTGAQDTSQETSKSPQSSPGQVDSANGSGIIRGFPIHEVNPHYPEKPRKKKKAQGKIVLRATIATDGSVKDVSVQSGDPELTPAALEAVRQWRYLPELRDGSAIESQTTVTLEYDLSKGASRPGNPPPGVPTAPSEDLITEFATGEIWIGGEVRPPRGIYTPDPEYPEEARQAKFQGTDTLGVVLGHDGLPRDVWIVRGSGMGLDEKSIEAVKHWRFTPATRDGRPVAVFLSVETTFRTY
jgi:TonB family protein